MPTQEVTHETALVGCSNSDNALAGCGDSGNDYDPTADSEKERFMTICATNGAVWERTYSGCRDAWREYVSLLSYMDEQFSEKQWKYDCVVDVAMRVARSNQFRVSRPDCGLRRVSAKGHLGVTAPGMTRLWRLIPN